jgi:hypothetical protein
MDANFTMIIVRKGYNFYIPIHIIQEMKLLTL